jgi:predicted nucleic acid-binding protein
VNYLLDTNIISEIRKGVDCNPHVATWYDSIDEDTIYVSVLVLGEIRKGIERARSTNPGQACALEQWLSALSQSFANRIVPIDLAVAEEWGRMSAKRPVSTVDALLAATAKVQRMMLVTRNVADVADLGAKVINPFEATR